MPMRRPPPDLILHIGQSKTGTSSIQRCLGARREALLAEGVLYPRSPGAANHGLLPASLVPVERLGHFHPNIWEGLAPEARLARFREEFAAEMDAAIRPGGPRRVVLSAEQCSGLLDDVASVRRLHALLAPRFSAMRVVVYLRRQDLHWASGYAQALRVAQVRPPALPPGGPEALRDYDYAALLDRWARVFGAEAVTPRVFERGALLDGDVVDDFCALCGLQVRIPRADPDRRSNASIAPEGLALMRAVADHLRRTDPATLSSGSPLWRRFAQAVSEALPGPGWRPGPAEAAAFVARFAASNEAVRARWFPDRARLFSDEFADPGAAAAAAPSEAEAALEAACALLLRGMAAAQAGEARHAVQLGRLHEQLGQPAAARRAYGAALRAVPEDPAAHFFQANLDLADGDAEAAAAHLDTLRRAHPDDPHTAPLERRLRQSQRRRVAADRG
jgi:tetratricopeptide (TPR) repeat protein